uniref:K Homology domain-containing protein n=1 Tax=Ditylenchus dipsaci TaxID=166011 RepID=A0A915DLQ7_9BILA
MQIKALPADVEISEVECGKGLLLDELAYNGSERESYVDVFINEDQGYKTQSDHDGKDLTYFEPIMVVSMAKNGLSCMRIWQTRDRKRKIRLMTPSLKAQVTERIDIGVSLANSGRAEAKEGSLLDVQQADKAPKSGSDVSIPENPSDGVLGDYDNKDVTTFEICVPREIVPCCEKGVLSIYHIRKKSGAKISRKKKNETQHMITVTGTADQVEMAVSCMQQNLMQSEEGECYLAEEGGNWNIGSAQLEMKSYA